MSERTLTDKTILVTGAAGFIGVNLMMKLIDNKEPSTAPRDIPIWRASALSIS